MMLEPERPSPAREQQDSDTETERIADLIAAEGPTGTIVPARIRQIDKRLRDAGWSQLPDDLVRLDKGSSSQEPMTSADFAVAAVTMVRSGRRAMHDQGIGDTARALRPADSASPLVSMVEHAGENPGGSVLDFDGVVPDGDLREHARQLVATTSVSVLRLAWQTVQELRRWAETLCTQVESELDSGVPGGGRRAWVLATTLVAREQLVTALRPGRTPTDDAQRTVGLLMVREMLLRLRQQLPNGAWHLLANPDVVPSSFLKLLDSDRVHTRPGAEP
jgi:hypothetical protein